MATSGGHMHGAADLKPDTAIGYVLTDSGSWSTVGTAGLTDLGVTTAKLAANAVTSAKLDPTTIQYAEVSLTSAQIKALRATPATLVPAVAGSFIEFRSAVLFLDYGTNVFTESADNLAIYFAGETVGVSEVIECTGFLDQAADMVIECRPTSSAAKTAANTINKALTLKNTGDGEFGGNAANDSVLRVKVAYRVHASGF